MYFFCNYDDGTLVVSMDVKKDIVRVIRQVRPDTVITLDPCMVYDVEMGYINHPDHRAAGQAALDAVFPLARDHLSFPELLKDEGLHPHNVTTVLLTHFGKQNCYIDVSNTFETKLHALAAHASQYPDFPAIETMMRTMATKLGADADVSYAEGFVRLEVR